MAFADALFDGRTELEGVLAKRAPDLPYLLAMHRCARAIPVTTVELTAVVQTIKPDVLVDARMRKREQPQAMLGLATLTIGLGPNFIAGQTADVVIETAWGPQLGQVIMSGPSLPLSGEPNPIEGHARDRFIYAPVAGLFETTHRIGDAVEKGEIIGKIGITNLRAPLTGVIRGLTHDQVPVKLKTKIIEVDPRRDAAGARGLGERPKRIARGVLEALGSGQLN
jgi:xanthine dehydrogenase accessory factor